MLGHFERSTDIRDGDTFAALVTETGRVVILAKDQNGEYNEVVGPFVGRDAIAYAVGMRRRRCPFSIPNSTSLPPDHRDRRQGRPPEHAVHRLRRPPQCGARRRLARRNSRRARNCGTLRIRLLNAQCGPDRLVARHSSGEPARWAHSFAFNFDVRARR